ncbi:hypothetical protein ACP275_14G213300 [Erythranthe tilingii]
MHAKLSLTTLSSNQNIDMADCPGKNFWPELLGANGDAAAAVIERQNPNVNAVVSTNPTPTTRDFRCDRVWIWVNANGVVLRAPRAG